jgi:hypothetical protein
MTIINDRIQFIADDFAGLSADAKAALIPYCGTNPFHQLLSDTANNHLITAQRVAWSSVETPELLPLAVNFRKATESAQATVVGLLKAQEDFLKENVKPLNPALDIASIKSEIKK